MSFDGIMTQAVVQEVQQTLQSGRITKIHQPYKTDLVITVRANRKNHQLLLSVNPSLSRMHLTDEKYQNPPEPSMFCMLLRKHLEGGFVREVSQQGLERIVSLRIENKDEIGDLTERTLVMEIMGKHSNVVLLNEDRTHILDSMKHISPAQNTVRTILPGQTYIEPPSQHKANPLEAEAGDVLRALDANQGKLDRQLMQAFEGISPQSAKETAHRAGLGSLQKLADTFTALMSDVKIGNFQPQIVTTEASKEYYSAIDLTHVDGTKETFDSVSAMLDRYHNGKAERDRVHQQAHDLERFLQNEREKNERKLKKLHQTITQAENRLVYQKYGELLTAHMHQLRGGENEIEVTDYYDPEGGTLTIELEPELSPSDNAQRYFKRYNKAKTSLSEAKKQIKLTRREIDYLDRLIQQVETAAPSDIDDIREELSDGGYLKKRVQKKKQRKNTKPQVEQYVSSAGILLLVGKNNRQNEYVTNRVANVGDTWLHTKDIPGSHVVIRSTDVDEETLKEAAVLAAYFSKARSSSSVPVDYTLIRHVRKPNGAKPGFVTYDQQSTLFVTPEESLVLEMKNRAKAQTAAK